MSTSNYVNYFSNECLKSNLHADPVSSKILQSTIAIGVARLSMSLLCF